MATTELAAPGQESPRESPGQKTPRALSAAQAAAARVERRARRSRWLLTAPALLTISIFGILPLIIIVIYSFLKPAPYGGVAIPWQPTLDAYVSFLFQKDIFSDDLLFSPDF